MASTALDPVNGENHDLQEQSGAGLGRGDGRDGNPAMGIPKAPISSHAGGTEERYSAWMQKTGFLGHSDSVFDAWLTAVTSQLGQLVLTLPNTLAQMGYGWGLVALIGIAFTGVWSVYMLTWLYFEFLGKLAREEKEFSSGHILQFHEVIEGLVGRVAGRVTALLILGSLFVAGVIMIVSSGSNLYYADDSLNKRDWVLVVGAISTLSIFMPTLRHYRGLAFLGVTTTSITAVYLLIAATSHGQESHVRHTGPKDNLQFFMGVTNLIFAFGGHGITIEVMEAMRRPTKFRYVYIMVVIYTLLFVIPSGVSVYWAYGDILLQKANALSVVPISGWRKFAVSLMVVHQFAVFNQVNIPIFLALEKWFGIYCGYQQNLGIWRVLVRLPAVLVSWFMALAVPFFGIINSIMGALVLSLGTYAIPPLCFLFVFRTAASRDQSMQQPPFLVGRSWAMLFFINGLVVIGMVTMVHGLGGWASVSKFIEEIHHVGFFDRCYEC